ncbi:hypothetical protein AGOR_G00075800 [Albula goreensis]|uniref:Uncharacterized protein n=1 Tax=Albula goreensis TaxID=1534307 RepID=A0A8T3DNX0_9TELE|nr:hypothetical protein AGOR_G00075800 [Albula goreensis]
MRSQFLFMLVSCCTFLLFTWGTYHLTLKQYKREQNYAPLKLMQCKKLREKYSSVKNLKRGNVKAFSDDMRNLMSCPWIANRTKKERYRIDLYSCCNATQSVILTKDNTALGQKITYDAEKRTRVVDKSLHKMLPQSTPWRTEGQLGHCAVVGNGGILKNSTCGSQINKADFVIRLNLAPINFSKDVGVKTSLVTANPTQIKNGYPNLRKNPQPLANRMAAYGNASLLMPAFAYSFCTALSFQVHQSLKPLRPQQKVVFFNPNYLRMLDRYWRKKGQRANRLSSGLMLASVAMELCDEVHLYGFWPFSFGLSEEKLTHHYYDNVGPRPGAHSMPQEFLHLLHLHNQGVINLHIGKC